MAATRATRQDELMVDRDARRRERGHSFYASLASFATACFSLTLLTDLAYWATASVLWETMSVWLLTVGLVVAALCVPAGIFDVVRSRKVFGLGQPWLMVVGQVCAFALSIVNVLVHSRDGYTAVVPQGVTLSFVVVLILLVTAVAGRAMVARRRAQGFA